MDHAFAHHRHVARGAGWAKPASWARPAPAPTPRVAVVVALAEVEAAAGAMRPAGHALRGISTVGCAPGECRLVFAATGGARGS